MNDRYQIVDCAKIWKQIVDSGITQDANAYKIAFTYGNTSINISGFDTLDMLLDFFGYGYGLPMSKYVTGTPMDWCAYDFGRFCTWHHNDFIKIMEAYTAEYNPIENYNGTMTITDTVSGDNPYSKTKTITGTVKRNSNVTAYGASGSSVSVDGNTFSDFESKDYETTYDSTTDPTGAKLKNMTKSKPTGTYAHTVGNANDNYTTWDNYAETDTEHGEREHVETKHGNLGLTTSQSMVRDELSLRDFNFLLHVLHMYVNENLIMIGDE